MSTSFDTSAIVRAEKLTAAEKTTIAGVIDSIKHLNGLIEGARPTHAATHRKAKDAAGEVMTANPTPATIDAFRAALGNYLNPDALFQPIHDTLNHLIDVELKKLIPVAKRLHGAAASAVKDPKRFGIEAVEAIPDIARRGAALTDFAAGHSAAVVRFNDDAEHFDNGRSAYQWLTSNGFAEAIWG